MQTITKLPIGIENFEEIRTEGFYYVDKTELISELLNNWGKVNLFTRPRRFGKSLNMSTLKYFFEYDCNSGLFDGLKIAEEKELCKIYMGRFPVISITLKGASARNYETARAMLCSVIGREALRFDFLSKSAKLSDREKKQYDSLTAIGGQGQPGFPMSEDVAGDSLLTLSQLLYKHYGQKVILLVDEYDVPLDKAQQYGYYDEMLSLTKNLLGQALKSNDSLYFAVLTGCLRVAKESIFTGLNNLKVLSVTDAPYAKHFGFSDKEVGEMLKFYGFEDRYTLVREWYDGYQFGNTKLYCPWDVINYVDMICSEPDAKPKPFWINTSGNEIIRNFLQKASLRTKRELEQLVDGKCVAKKINQDLTYRDIYKNTDNLWSVLFMTGYLTQRGKTQEEAYLLAIPNLEIRQIFIDQILEWFQEEARKDTPKLDAFCTAFQRADAEAAEKLLNDYLKKTISIRDTGARRGRKENFYHGILLGLLSHREDWDIDSNAESGDGFCDILIEIEEEKIGIVIEVKYSEEGRMEAGCREALEQIEKMKYDTKLWQDGMTTIIKYGIACWKKSCRVRIKK